MNRVELTGRVEQLIYDPGEHRYDFGILSIRDGESRYGEIQVFFPKDVYYQMDIVGKNMSMKGFLSSDRHRDMYLVICEIKPCTAKMIPFGDKKPTWWKGEW